MIKTFSLEPGQPLTDEQLGEIEEARKHPIVFDKDCKELSPAMIKAFKNAAIRQDHRIKPNPREAVLLIGLQASGKSTFYRQMLSGDHVHINLDTLHTRNKEWLLLERCLQNGFSFTVDNTNPTIAEREKYIVPAKGYGYKITGYFFQSVIADCMERNRARQGKARVPDKAIPCTSNRLELPSYQEGFDQLYYVKLKQGRFLIEEWKETL